MSMNWQAVFLDFDGVILDSANIKTIAFKKMFEEYGRDIQQQVVQYHLDNSGVSRFDKFRYYYGVLLKKPIADEGIRSLSKRFSELVVQGVIGSPFVTGAYETLKLLKKHIIPVYVVSGTPHDEINFIVEKRDLVDFFVEVHGSPRKKYEITTDIMKRYGYQPSQCLFIGDSLSDYYAARRTGMNFHGVVKAKNLSPFPDEIAVSSKVQI
jgi:HAD superfamily hydrolase (TIGR01549 family)